MFQPLPCEFRTHPAHPKCSSPWVSATYRRQFPACWHPPVELQWTSPLSAGLQPCATRGVWASVWGRGWRFGGGSEGGTFALISPLRVVAAFSIRYYCILYSIHLLLGMISFDKLHPFHIPHGLSPDWTVTEKSALFTEEDRLKESNW